MDKKTYDRILRWYKESYIKIPALREHIKDRAIAFKEEYKEFEKNDAPATYEEAKAIFK